MKLKNVSPFERHVEKGILALGILLAVVVYWLFVSGEPYQVTIEQRNPGGRLIAEEITPETVTDLIEDRVEDLQDRIGPGSPAFDAPLPVLEYTNLFRERLARALLPARSTLLIALGEPGVDRSLIDVDQPTLRPYFVATPPPPTNLTYSHSYGVVSDLASVTDAARRASLRDQLIDIVGSHVPRDVRVVTIGAVYDLAEWRRRLQAAPPDDQQRIPEDWWRGAMLITDVQLDRQTLNPVTGKWGPTETIPMVPTATSARPLHDRRVWPGPEIQDAWAMLQQNQPAIRRPAVRPVFEGRWHTPDTPATSDAQPIEPGGDRVQVWAHDLTAQPGMTYRYQVRVYVVNPLFQKRPLIEEQVAQFQNTLSLESQASEWTDPIRTDESKYFFADQINPMPLQATFVVYYLFDGQWRTHTFTRVEPGEAIGGTITRTFGDRDMPVDLSMDAVLVDIDTGDTTNFVGANARVIYLDGAEGELRMRVVGRDRQHPKRQELDRQTAEADAVARGE